MNDFTQSLQVYEGDQISVPSLNIMIRIDKIVAEWDFSSPQRPIKHNIDGEARVEMSKTVVGHTTIRLISTLEEPASFQHQQEYYHIVALKIFLERGVPTVLIKIEPKNDIRKT